MYQVCIHVRDPISSSFIFTYHLQCCKTRYKIETFLIAESYTKIKILYHFYPYCSNLKNKPLNIANIR